MAKGRALGRGVGYRRPLSTGRGLEQMMARGVFSRGMEQLGHLQWMTLLSP